MSENSGSSFEVTAMFFLQDYIIVFSVWNLFLHFLLVFSEFCFKVGKGGLDPRFARGLLAGRDRKWVGFWSFGDIYFHLTRGRVPESLWKPHQSKAINFLCRNYVPTFFSTPKKILFFGIQNIFRNIFRSKIFFVQISRKSKILIEKHRDFQNLIQILEFSKISTTSN